MENSKELKKIIQERLAHVTKLLETVYDAETDDQSWYDEMDWKIELGFADLRTGMRFANFKFPELGDAYELITAAKKCIRQLGGGNDGDTRMES